MGLYTVLNKKLFNYKVVDRIEGYNFYMKFVFIWVYIEKYELFFVETIYKWPSLEIGFLGMDFQNAPFLH